MTRVVVALAVSVLTAAYWWVVFFVVYAETLFAGDRNAAPAPDAEVFGRYLAVIGGAILFYALLCLGWRWLAERVRRSR